MQQATREPVAELSLVLSGGGSRGIAHIGVLRALDERGIAVADAAGTSSGAIVGALHAAGYTPAEMLEFFRLKNPFHLSKLALSKPGFIDTAKIVADFEEYFPDNTFAALAHPLHVVATDIVTGEATVFDQGALIPAILASSAVPVVFTPVEIDGRWYSDGGIVNNFPVELVEGRGRVVIGSYASPLRAIRREDLGSSLAVLTRALEVGMFLASRRKFDRCTVLLSPPELGRFGLFDTKNLEKIESLGYRATLGALDAIERALVGGTG